MFELRAVSKRHQWRCRRFNLAENSAHISRTAVKGAATIELVSRARAEKTRARMGRGRCRRQGRGAVVRVRPMPQPRESSSPGRGRGSVWAFSACADGFSLSIPHSTTCAAVAKATPAST